MENAREATGARGMGKSWKSLNSPQVEPKSLSTAAQLIDKGEVTEFPN